MHGRRHTLTWLMTAFMPSALILMTMMWWAVPQAPAYVFIAFIAVAVADMLAGVIGFRFGRHRFMTRALFTTKNLHPLTRGLRLCGSDTTAVIICMHHIGALPPHQYQLWPALLILPPALTLAEAKSPHTWDEPVMFLTAMLAALLIVRVRA
jgi:CDP-diglyceride synthetase